MKVFEFEPVRLPPEAEALRQDIRAFLRDWRPKWSLRDRSRSWDGVDWAFSQAMGAKGWIGMTWPKAYGGSERSALERYVVLEEMLAAGAPVSAHWIADRQSGPLVLRYGTEAQKQAILPKIAKGEMCFCIGLSEPDAGSDVASLRARARKTDTGWVVNGTKLWTTNAHHAHYMIALLRTDGENQDRQVGLSQFLIDLSLPGVNVRPIADLTGENHFNEVVFTDVVLQDDALIGARGDGWKQVMAELALERSGPERFLSSIAAVSAMIQHAKANPSAESCAEIGRLAARLATLRRMSISVAGMLEAHRDPSVEACVVKDLGTGFEQTLPGIAQSLMGLDVDPESGGDLEQAVGHLMLMAPAFSLRGGTREILRGIIARGLGLR